MPGRAGYVLVDPVRAPIIKQIFEKVGNDRWSARTVYKWMVKEGKFNSVRKGNKALTLSTIYRLLHQPFYSGTFEYPTGSGNWYKGQKRGHFNSLLKRNHPDACTSGWALLGAVVWDVWTVFERKNDATIYIPVFAD